MDNKEQNPFIGIADVGQAEHILNKFRMDNPDESDALLQMLSDLLGALLMSNEELCGGADDFHNLAVTISKIANDNKNAYAIIKEGLKIHEVDTDLLADALLYGYNAGAKEECEHWYCVLVSIDKSRWTWRAFSFTITYLLNLYASEAKSGFTIGDVLNLATEYQQYRPDEEDAWISLYRIYNETNQQQKGIKVLEEAIKKFRFCPKCWLRYADTMVDYGDYEKAAPVIKKMLRSPNTSEYINPSYMHFLDGQCKMAKLMDTDDYDNGNIDEHLVRSIYRSFQLARKSQGLRESTNQSIDEYIERLTIETGIEFD